MTEITDADRERATLAIHKVLIMIGAHADQLHADVAAEIAAARESGERAVDGKVHRLRQVIRDAAFVLDGEAKRNCEDRCAFAYRLLEDSWTGADTASELRGD